MSWTGSVVINSGDLTCAERSVTLTIDAQQNGSAPDEMCFSNNLSTWSAWEPYSVSRAWTLSDGNGEKTVYVKFRVAL